MSMKKGQKMSEEGKRNLSNLNKGRKHTAEAVEKIRKASIQRGSIPPSHKGKVRSLEFKNKISAANKGKVHTEEMKEKNRQMHLGKKASIETRQKMRIAHLKRVAEGKHNNYKGGISTENHRIRGSLEYKLWREAVFERDNWTCIWGGKAHGNKLNADHIKPFAYYPELRFAIDNGRTLCEACHKTTDTYAMNINKGVLKNVIINPI